MSDSIYEPSEKEREVIRSILSCDGIRILPKYITKARALTTSSVSGHYLCAVGAHKFFVKITLHSIPPQLPRKHPSRTTVYVDVDCMRAIKKRIIDTGYSPHFAEILGIVHCEGVRKYIESAADCRDLSRGYIKSDSYPSLLLCDFLDFCEMGYANDKFTVSFVEACDLTLTDYFTSYLPILPREQSVTILTIAFQVIYSLHVAQMIWKGFRHNDLHSDNIMIQIYDDKRAVGHTKPQYLRYDLGNNDVFYIPFGGYFVKIIDFGNAEIPEEGILKSAALRSIHVLPDHIRFILNFCELINERGLARMFNQFLRYLNPLNYNLSTHVSVMMRDVDSFPTIAQILHSNFFDAFREVVKDKYIFANYHVPTPAQS